MADSLKETACTGCIHREVCTYKYDYLKIIEAVNNAEVHSTAPDGRHSFKKVSLYDFIEDINVLCKYYLYNVRR